MKTARPTGGTGGDAFRGALPSYQNSDPAANVAACWLEARMGLTPPVARLVAALAMLGARHV
jgi:hypothetical protein